MRSLSSKLNKLVFAIVLSLLCVCLCGCAKVDFVTYHNDDGSISEYVYLTINEQTISNGGYDINKVKLDIKTNSHIEANSLILEYRNKVIEQYHNKQITDCCGIAYLHQGGNQLCAVE